MRIWVLMGGDSPEREVSLSSGKAVVEALVERGHHVVWTDLRDGSILGASGPEGSLLEDLRRSTQGAVGWARALLAAAEVLGAWCEAVFPVLHGAEGEDGRVQAVLGAAGLPYVGSPPKACAVSMDKPLSKRLMESLGIDTPRWRLLTKTNGKWPPLAGAHPGRPGSTGPVVVKPPAAGSSVGISIVEDESGWEPALELASSYSEGAVLVEEFVPGREVTVGILGQQALPVVEILPHEGFYDYAHKYEPGRSSYEVPARLPGEISGLLRKWAIEIFKVLGCRDMARVDFRLDPTGQPKCLELNAIPGLTSTSLLPKAASAAGVGFGEMLEQLCGWAAGRADRSR